MVTLKKLHIYALALLALAIASFVFTQPVSAEDDPEKAEEAEKLRKASSTTVRHFHEVLNELLAEFGYDVKMGQIKGLKNLSVRKVDVSSALPKTYKKYTNLLVSERIRENSTVKVISCISCSTKTSKLVEGKLLITSPSTNIALLKQTADKLGIDNFMDVVLIYHTTHMVLGFQIFNVQTNEMVWARTYNSETIKSRYQKLAIDYRQVAKSRPGEDYVPEYRLLIGLGGSAIPNVAGDTSDSSMLGIHFRASEKFDNRHSEFGMLFILYKSVNSLLKSYPTSGPESNQDVDEPDIATPKPFETALGLYGIYGHNFLGAVESYNNVRHGIHFGLGVLMASGYLAGSLKIGWDAYFGRRFVTSISASYIAPSQILINNESLKTKGGAGADLVLSFNY